MGFMTDDLRQMAWLCSSGSSVFGRDDSLWWQGVGGRDPICRYVGDSGGLLHPNEAVLRSGAWMASLSCAARRLSQWAGGSGTFRSGGNDEYVLPANSADTGEDDGT